MENDQIFEAEVALEGNEFGQSVAQHTDGNNTGARTIVAGNGGYDKHIASTNTEEMPLLPSGSGNGNVLGGDHNGNSGTRWLGESDFEGLPWWKKPSIYWLLPAYSIFAIAFGGLIVPRLNLVVSLICREYLAERGIADPAVTFVPVVISGDNPQCQIEEVKGEISALSSKFMLYISLIGGILAAITSPKIGTLSDRYGRKPLLALTTVGGLISEVIWILVGKYPDHIRYMWLLAGAIIEGICGSFIAGWAMTHSYATDCTPPVKRAVAFGYFQGCLFIGIAIGPIIAAYIEEAAGTVLGVFYFAFIVHTFFFCFILFVMPESLSQKRQLAARERLNMEPRDNRHIFARMKSANLLAPLKILYPTGEGSSPQLRVNLLLLSAVSTILFGSAMASMTVVLLYAKYQFLWEDKEANLFLSAANISRVSALIVVLPLLNYIFRTRYKNKVRRESGIELLERNSGSDNLDLWTIRSALVFEILGYGGYAVVKTSSLFVMSAIFAAVGGIGSPIIQSALTKHVPHDRTGQVLGATGLLHALARVVFPAGITYIYAYTVKQGSPQIVFIILVGCFATAFLCSVFIRPHIYLEEHVAAPSMDNGHAHMGEEAAAS